VKNVTTVNVDAVAARTALGRVRSGLASCHRRSASGKALQLMLMVAPDGAVRRFKASPASPQSKAFVKCAGGKLKALKFSGVTAGKRFGTVKATIGP